MGQVKSALCPPNEDPEALAAAATTPVWLHVYDVGHAKIIQKLDSAVSDFLGLGGVFHGAVEIYGREWSFGATRKDQTGVFCAMPKRCKSHTYKQSVYMGDCGLDAVAVKAILAKMQPEWNGRGYNLLRRNCCSFSDAFCIELGVGPIPKWVHRLADTGAALSDEQQAIVRGLHHLEDEVAHETEVVLEILGVHKQENVNAALSKPPPPPPPEGGRTVIAPPGKLAIVFHMHTDGHAIVTTVKPESPLAGKLRVGDIVLAVDGEDTSKHTEKEICDHLIERQDFERALTLLAKY